MYDYIIIGGGIIGISTALALKIKNPDKRLLLLEKEKKITSHQTGRNSGVVHSGVYYKPDSLKAKFCKMGLTATIDFCIKYNIAYKKCGKLLVANTKEDVVRMQALYKNCIQNKLAIEMLNEKQLSAIEPNVRGLQALFIKSTAITNYAYISKKMLALYKEKGGEYLLNTKVLDLKEEVGRINVITKKTIFSSKYLVSCAGLQADKVVQMLNIKTDFKIIPFRGEYYKLNETNNLLVSHLIYPIPNPKLPFLGIHLTPLLDGGIIVGPNAVLSFNREGYSKMSFSLQDSIDMLSFIGFSRMVAKYFKVGVAEAYNSLYKKAYLQQVQKYVTSIKLEDLRPYPAGIRAQAVATDGSLIDDFLFVTTKRSTHVGNAPSPAATSAIPIGNYISQKVTKVFNKLS